MTTAILDFRPAARPALTLPGRATRLGSLFGLDSLPARPLRLVCHWHREADGRLSCIWEPDIALVSQR